MDKLLSRDEFRESVFERDGHMCVVCQAPAVDAHHIIERRLWVDEGYYLSNGASLCETHHKMAERNQLSPHVIRYFAQIEKRIIPKQLNPEFDYNKWGEPFYVLSKQGEKKAIEIVKIESDDKYPSTYYFPFSPTIDPEYKTDVVDVKNFLGMSTVLTIKMDGSNVKLNRQLVAARNGHDANHKSFDMLKSMHAKIKNRIPEGIDVFGEWLYAKHSIHYTKESSNPLYNGYLQIFAAYLREQRIWLGWKDISYLADNMGVKTVPVIVVCKPYDNEWEFQNTITKYAESVIKQGHEGIVVRSQYPFHFCQLQTLVGKYVRANHVQTSDHWSQQNIVRNEVDNA